MKKLLIIILAITIVLCTCSCGKSTLYPETAIVVAVDEAKGTVTVETYTENIFEFYGVEDWCQDDCVSMIMDSCGTPSIEDDVIITAKYSGVLEN